MTDTIKFERGWKKAVRKAWLRRKLLNMDLRGTGRNLKSLIVEAGLDPDQFYRANMFRSWVKTLRTYGEWCVISPVGMEVWKKEQERHGSTCPVEPQDEVWESEHFTDSGDCFTSLEHLMVDLEKAITKHNVVYFKIGGENPTTLEKGDNWEYYKLVKEA